MLQELRIKNFKGWQDTGQIRMAPITLFFGVNSSGKSSIGHFLMMLKQTVESPDRKAVFYPGGRSTAVQLGSFKEMVFQRDSTKKIEFKYIWTLEDDFKIQDPISKDEHIADTIAFEAQTGLIDKEQQSLALERMVYQLCTNNEEALSIEMIRQSTLAAKYKIKASNYKLIRNPGRAWDPGAPVRFYGFPDEVVAYYQNADFVQALNLWHEKLFRSISYLGPLRTKAERLYAWSGIHPESVHFAGEQTISAILAARKRKLNFGERKRLKPFEEIIAQELLEMDLIEEFKVKPISRQRQEYEVNVRVKGSKHFVDLPDVGFGVSQVLPVIVQCFYAPPNSIIIMEQPEIHLHPSAQAALADVMIHTIKSREKGIDRNIQLIIETHSEHFLRRLQRRVAEGVVSEEEVSAYFANVARTPAQLEPLDVDMFGNIHNWPDNFFGDQMTDIAEHSKAAMKKRMNQKELIG